MICVSSQCATLARIEDMCFYRMRGTGNVAQLRNTYRSIRLDELNQNLSSAHRLVEISTRYRCFTTAHAQLPNSSPIFLEFAD